MFFKNNKLKVKSEVIDNKIKFNIDYYKIKDKSNFKVKIMSDFIGNNFCLAVIDTKLQYNEGKNNIDELINYIEAMDFPYKKIVVKGEETLKILGISTKASGGKKINNYIIGFVFTAEKLDKMEKFLENFSIYFCLDDKYIKAEELLNKLQFYYEDEEKMLEDFELSVFNGIAFNNMCVKTSTENLKLVNEIIEKYKQK